jgi:hypothetical protein
MEFRLEAVFDYMKFDNNCPDFERIVRRVLSKRKYDTLHDAALDIYLLNEYLCHNVNVKVNGYMIEVDLIYKNTTYITNQRTAQLFLKLGADMRDGRKRLLQLEEYIETFESEWPSYTVNLVPPPVGLKEEVFGFVRQIRANLVDMTAYANMYGAYEKNVREFDRLTDEQAVGRLNRALYKRAFAFDVDKPATLGESVIGKIREFVGEDFLEAVRRTTTSDRYFPHPRKKNIVAALWKWKLVDLVHYSKHAFISYKLERAPRRDKASLIRAIVSGNTDFYELHRDLGGLTPP